MNPLQKKDVSTPCGDYDAMASFWGKVDAILGGTETMRKRKDFLPILPNENDRDYGYRLKGARFSNVWRDIAENLAAKPFAKEISLSEATPEQLAFIEDVDGRGNHIHTFAASMFFQALCYGLHWVFVDYPQVPEGAVTLAEAATRNLRPYWVSLPATSVIAAESKIIGGKSFWSHIRFRADVKERVGYEEIIRKRIRQYDLDDATMTVSCQVWEEVEDGGQKKWVLIEGPFTMAPLKEIPIVLLTTGRRVSGDIQVAPLLRDAAELQLVLYKLENALEYAKENTAFPMLAGNGIEAPRDADGKISPLPVGPKAVLYAPPSTDSTSHGEWAFIEPNASSLTFLASDIERTETQLRELGRQPLTAQTGNLTTVMAAQSASKGNSAIAAAALMLKDALERCLLFTARWQGNDDSAEVEVHTDFDVGLNETDDITALTNMRNRGDISQDTLWEEMKRRNVLSANFDAEQEKERIAEELPSPDEMSALMDAGGAALPGAGKPTAQRAGSPSP